MDLKPGEGPEAPPPPSPSFSSLVWPSHGSDPRTQPTEFRGPHFGPETGGFRCQGLVWCPLRVPSKRKKTRGTYDRSLSAPSNARIPGSNTSQTQRDALPGHFRFLRVKETSRHGLVDELQICEEGRRGEGGGGGPVTCHRQTGSIQTMCDCLGQRACQGQSNQDIVFPFPPFLHSARRWERRSGTSDVCRLEGKRRRIHSWYTIHDAATGDPWRVLIPPARSRLVSTSPQK